MKLPCNTQGRAISVWSLVLIYLDTDWSLHNLVANGKSIIMVSSDFEELTGMSDRIIVIAEGHKAGEKLAGDYDKEVLLDLASGER